MIGGVLVAGAAAPKLVTAEMVKRMKPGAAIVDVAIDQAGVSKPRMRRHTVIQPISWMMWCTIVWQICRVRWPERQPLR
ncbi:alanine dehydrogenase [Photobacterium aphoticum]|uniref:Alanine dehydrogenase n=1 Tax=Photobacterium aphoticum TaxID=754436 RepID=A0A090R2B3_9GAMM|nr:alanine dehydrogenase [Photobacterium aphoticum]